MENNKFPSAIEGNVGPMRVKRVEPPPTSYGKEVCEPKVSLVSTWVGPPLAPRNILINVFLVR